jgi:quercetin dioxygenase-like cupin family protein
VKVERYREATFVPCGIRGVTYHTLYENRRTGRLTALVRMAPGTSLRAHAHDEQGEVEECLVLEGELRVGDEVMRAGDYQRALPGSEHDEQRTETGALLYFSGTLDFLIR